MSERFGVFHFGSRNTLINAFTFTDIEEAKAKWFADVAKFKAKTLDPRVKDVTIKVLKDEPEQVADDAPAQLQLIAP